MYLFFKSSRKAMQCNRYKEGQHRGAVARQGRCEAERVSSGQSQTRWLPCRRHAAQSPRGKREGLNGVTRGEGQGGGAGRSDGAVNQVMGRKNESPFPSSIIFTLARLTGARAGAVPRLAALVELQIVVNVGNNAHPTELRRPGTRCNVMW